MGRLYTFDEKLLCGSPEVRIGDKVFSIDDRKNTVKKALKLFDKKNAADESDEFDKLDELFRLAFGRNFQAIEELELSFSAYNELAEIVISAMTGEEFKKKKEQSFPESGGDVV